MVLFRVLATVVDAPSLVVSKHRILVLTIVGTVVRDGNFTHPAEPTVVKSPPTERK